MSLDLRRVHDYEKGPGNTVVMKRINPAVRIRWSAGEPPIFIQNGEFYAEGGQRVPRKDLPEGFWKEAARLSQEAKRECGLVLPDEAEAPKTQTEKAPAPRATKGRFAPKGLAPTEPQDDISVLRSDMKQLAGTVDKLVGAVNGLLEERANKPGKRGKRRAAA